MIEKIFSKIQEDLLLHMVNFLDDTGFERINIAPESEFLQAAVLNKPKGATFKPHKHIWKAGKHKVIAQESWVVIKGKVKFILYDIDDTIIAEKILHAGDCSMTFCGGHNYEILEDNTIVYEFKTGPYCGQALDKEFIND